MLVSDNVLCREIFTAWVSKSLGPGEPNALLNLHRPARPSRSGLSHSNPKAGLLGGVVLQNQYCVLRPGYGHPLCYLGAALMAITSPRSFCPTCYGTGPTSNAILLGSHVIQEGRRRQEISLFPCCSRCCRQAEYLIVIHKAWAQPFK